MDGLGAVLLVVILIGLAALALVVWALVVALRREAWAWVAAIVVSLIALGVVAPIVAAVYLITYRKNGPTPATPKPSGPPPAEGWYEDPGGEYDRRWWNGHAWTDQVLDAGITRTRPIPTVDPPR
ncbi:MAG: DUF2510 domain-containing protein [Actinomycetota bacterium]